MSEKELDEFINRFLTNYPGQESQEHVIRTFIKSSNLNSDQVELIEILSSCIAREISADALLRFQQNVKFR